MQAGASDLVTLDDRHIEAGGRAVEGRGVATRTSPDHDDIELLDLVSHGASLQ
jgi:hypothetical protein